MENHKGIIINHSIGKKKVKYDVDFPKTYDMGNMTKVEERFVNAILSELYNKPYSPDGFTIPYSRIALSVGGQFVKKQKNADGNTYYYPQISPDFINKIEELKNKLVTVSYQKVIATDEKGVPIDYEEIFLFTDRVRVDHTKQEYKVYLSDSIIEPEIIENIDGHTVITPEKRVYQLFYNENWGNQTKIKNVDETIVNTKSLSYLQYNLTIHNSLKSQYSMRLYRELAGYRTYVKNSYFAYADRFEKEVMKFDTPSLMQNKSVLIKKALAELKSLKDQYGNPLIPGLEMDVVRRNRRTYKYEFKFKSFTNDLLPVKAILGDGIYELDFKEFKASNTQANQNTKEFFEVLDVFHKLFGTDMSVDNPNNRNTLASYLEIMDKNLMIFLMENTVKNNKNFGATVKILRICKKENLITIEDFNKYNQLINDPNKIKMEKLSKKDADLKLLLTNLETILENGLSPFIIDDLEKAYLEKGLSPLVINEAAKIANYKGKDNWKYIKGILNNWMEENIFSEQDLLNFRNEENSNDKNKEFSFSDDFLNAMNLWSDD